MNIIKSFNNTIDYLETVLDGKISEKEVTQLSGYSYSMFSRLFSILTEMTLSEYLIRFEYRSLRTSIVSPKTT